MSLSNRVRKARLAGNVSRFHTHQLIRPDTVAQHTFNVFHTAMILTEGNMTPALMKHIMCHDLGEYASGDIPSHVKRLVPGLKEAANELEDKFVKEIHTGDLPHLTEYEYQVLKFCDNLDGLCKCLDELNMGNRNLNDVAMTYRGYLIKMQHFSPRADELSEYVWDKYLEAWNSSH